MPRDYEHSSNCWSTGMNVHQLDHIMGTCIRYNNWAWSNYTHNMICKYDVINDHRTVVDI